MEILQFSGGLDSLACLELLKDRKGLTVVTVSTDGSYPERKDYLAKVAAAHPHLNFITVNSQRHLGIHGRPVDVVPSKYTLMGNVTTGSQLRYQTHFQCCNRGLWWPMHRTMKELGATMVFRGQRKDDKHRAPIEDGYVEDGIMYRMPLAEWSREQVEYYVKVRCPDLVPEYYATELTSRDCWDCTAYLSDNTARIRNLPKEQYIEVTDILEQWRRDVNEETRW